MKVLYIGVQAGLTACFVVGIGIAGLHYMYSDRVPLHVRIGEVSLGGMIKEQVPGAISAYAQQLQRKQVRIRVRGVTIEYSFDELGIELDRGLTERAVVGQLWIPRHSFWTQVHPALVYRDDIAKNVLRKGFADLVQFPKDASLIVDPQYRLVVIPGIAGEDVDMVSFRRDISRAVAQSKIPVIDASIVSASPGVENGAVVAVRPFAETLLRSGFHVLRNEDSYHITTKSIAQLMRFSSEPSAHIEFDQEILREYLKSQIALAVYKEAVNARFKMEDGIVKQFALPQKGIELDIEATKVAIEESLARQEDSAQAVMREVEPVITEEAESSSLGITALLARGETDFRGSPKNRTKNIAVGADRFNGILIAPNEEFSFVKYLGPVDAEAGYFPELVIKNHSTIPEYGGGLCQVSTTTFRAAMAAGLPITERHNHSYAVAYYGTPGFDATIYPPYTDFRFLNNTPGHLLIQTRIDGTKLIFEFWGTADGRSSTIDGPHPYDKMPDGAVKAVLKRTVVRDGQTIIEDTFTSKYKSPNLFPHGPATTQPSAPASAAPSA